MDNSFNLICYDFQQKIIDIFNEQDKIPFQLKYFLFKEVWKIIKETKIKNDYEIQILKSKQQKSISTSIPVSNDFFQNNSEEIGEESN